MSFLRDVRGPRFIVSDSVDFCFIVSDSVDLLSFLRRLCEGDVGCSDVEDDDDFDDDIAEEGRVQLGVVVPIEGPPEKILFKNVDWHDWDGGKAGGWPVSCVQTCIELNQISPTV